MQPFSRVEIFLQSPDTGRYDMELLNRTIDICTFFRNSLYEPLLQIIYGLMLENGNFPKSCPLKTVSFLITICYIITKNIIILEHILY